MSGSRFAGYLCFCVFSINALHLCNKAMIAPLNGFDKQRFVRVACRRMSDSEAGRTCRGRSSADGYLSVALRRSFSQVQIRFHGLLQSTLELQVSLHLLQIVGQLSGCLISLPLVLSQRLNDDSIQFGGHVCIGCQGRQFILH